MGANALKGFGLGLAAFGETLGKGMQADITARKAAEEEARKEAALERRWKAELTAKQEENKAERDLRAAEGAAQRELYRDMESGRNERLDKQIGQQQRQLDLAERRSMVDDIDRVEQAGMNAAAKLQQDFIKKSQEAIELYPNEAERAKYVDGLVKQLNDTMGQINAQVQTRRQQVASAYGDAGLNYLKDITFEKGKGGLFPTELPGVETDPKADPKADPRGGKTVVLPGQGDAEAFSFGPVFDIARQTAAGEVPWRQSLAQAKELYQKPKSPADLIGVPAAILTGTVTGGLQNLGGGLWDLTTTRR